MSTTLTPEQLRSPLAKLEVLSTEYRHRYPGERAERQPVHTVYGGAQLFKETTVNKLGELARAALEEYAPDADALARILGLPGELAARVYDRVTAKLEQQPVEDFRIDFEDGFGNRPDAEEDEHAVRTAEAVAAAQSAGTLSPFIGIRIKPLTAELRERAIRTLDIFLSTYCSGDVGVPANFVVTLPKVTMPEEVAVLADVLDTLEAQLGIDEVPIELMIEMPQAIVGADGRVPLPALAAAARGRCRGAHFGTYDYTAGCTIIAEHQHMLHPACDFAKHMMQVSYAGTGIWLSDGATNVMPVGEANVVEDAWRLHYHHVTHSLITGFYQGWDLHPAQLPTRYAAVYAFFLSSLDAAGERLRNFMDKAAQATLVGDVFDDAATGQGLLNFFLRALNCGAIDEDEATRLSSMTLEELRSRSFVKILEGRRAAAN